MISTQPFPKLILHLSAEVVDRKISVRQENIGWLHPIGGEEFFFFNKRVFSGQRHGSSSRVPTYKHKALSSNPSTAKKKYFSLSFSFPGMFVS
jgi:hypothetical protein